MAKPKSAEPKPTMTVQDVLDSGTIMDFPVKEICKVILYCMFKHKDNEEDVDVTKLTKRERVRFFKSGLREAKKWERVCLTLANDAHETVVNEEKMVEWAEKTDETKKV